MEELRVLMICDSLGEGRGILWVVSVVNVEISMFIANVMFINMENRFMMIIVISSV